MTRKRIMILIYLCVFMYFSTLVMAQAAGIGPLSESVWADAPAQASGSKGKPAAKRIVKVKAPRYFDPVWRYLPFSFGTGGRLAAPRKGQIQIDARVVFARVTGTVQRDIHTTPAFYDVVEFHRDLGLDDYFPVFKLTAQYQFLPAWGVRYSFTPIEISSSPQLDRSFTFMGYNFISGSQVNTRWERFDHRLGLVYNLVRKPSSVVSAYGQWLHSQVTLSIEDANTAASLGVARFDDDKNLAVLGLEVEKSFTSFRDSAIGLKCKAGVAFLDDHVGYEAEAALSYAIQVSAQSQAFFKGGYRYAQLEKDETTLKTDTTVDGAFIEIGFLL